jgi:hypothetical protein
MKNILKNLCHKNKRAGIAAHNPASPVDPCSSPSDKSNMARLDFSDAGAREGILEVPDVPDEAV